MYIYIDNYINITRSTIATSLNNTNHMYKDYVDDIVVKLNNGYI